MKAKLMAMLLAAGAALGAWAAELTVHDGTATNNRIPFDGYRLDQCSSAQVVYPASELQDMTGKSIAAIRWYVSTSSPAVDYSSQVAIYLKEVNYTTLSTLEDTNTCTRVYTGTLSIVPEGTVTVTLDTPFPYQGGNLLYALNNEVTGYYKTRSFFGQSVSGASLAQGSPSGSPEQQNFIPKTTFFCTIPAHTVSGLPTTNATVTVDGVATNVPASGEISVAEGAAVKVTPAVGYQFESFTATAVEPPPATDTYEPGAATTTDLSTLTGDYVVPDGWTLTGTLDGSTQPYKISIAAGAKVTLRDATINGVSDNSSYAWPGLSCEGDATITLKGTNTVTGFYQASGLFVPASKTLTIRGPGSLDAKGTSTGAGIGAYGTSADCGRIVISSGTIKATGGANAAGIGGGWGYYGYNNYKAQCDGIAIWGGVVTATAVGYAAGIGGGRYGSCGDITISGGVVTATGHGGGAGIGAGEDGGGCGNIIISGGRVTATGSTNAAGIGSGWYSKARCGTITISSGITRVAATSPYNPIGQGLAACGTVTIDPSLNDTTEENTRTLTPPPFAAMANADGSYSFTVPKSDVAVTQVLGLVPEITATIAAIDAIGDVAYTDECKAKIDAASAAYNALTDAQKALVANAATLTVAETTYAALKAAADAAAADAAAAAAVTAAIDAIGDVAYTDESKAKIDAARAAYDALTGAQKALVTNTATLTAAEAAYAALTPDPVAPAPASCYALINEADVVAPYAAEKAVTLVGAAYDGCDVIGIVELKLGKVSAKKGASKVSGSVTTLDGKKHTAKAVTVTGIDGTAPAVVSLEVKDLGMMAVTIGGTQFAGTLGGTYHVQSAAVGGSWPKATATAAVQPGNLSVFAGDVLANLLPTNEVAAVSGGKWKFEKAASVKWAKAKGADEKTLVVDTSKGTNLSGLKLTYTPKKGTFKGSFNVYALEGTGAATKLKKYKVNVSGVVVGGAGYGKATCKKPAVSWPMTVQ